MSLKERLSKILSLNLAKNYTAVSYAMMVDGEIWVADALGTDGTEEAKPATVDHTFNVCSISKIFCTVAVMKLVEQGKVDLDTPVYKYLPDFKMLDERYKDITVRHLLNHASGLPGTQWKHFSATHISSEDNHEYYQEVYDHLAKSHLKAAPGTYSVYCNDGFTVAEMVVAKVSGMPFGQFVKEYITEPIGAHSTRSSTVNNPDYPLIQ
ncbi:MAG: beta-lactamase family protein [Oscillospiraceae bacterium]|nr:beta-lactamase family protein [Oscillospiraceae bacterium]